MKNPVLHPGLKKTFLYLVPLHRTRECFGWEGTQNLRVPKCREVLGVCRDRDCSRCASLHPFPRGNLEESSGHQDRKISAAPQGHTGCASFYQEGLKAPKAQESAWSSRFCLILFLSNSQKCNQNHPQAKSDPNFLPGSLSHTNPNVPKSLWALQQHRGTHRTEAAPFPCPKHFRNAPRSCSFQQWPLLFCTVII